MDVISCFIEYKAKEERERESERARERESERARELKRLKRSLD
jgi:hypothetical protein